MAPTLYFAFGSNLWRSQMASRCPSSPLAGLGRLRGYTWFINARGYANIAPSSPKDRGGGGGDEVWGLVYTLSHKDEAQLDLNEGVPWAYEKRVVEVEFLDTVTKEGGWGPEGAVNETGVGVGMLVYVDFQRCVGGYEPREEYVRRMNEGIRDALAQGVPRGYVDYVLRRYIPEEVGEGESGREQEVKELALRQARRFRGEEAPEAVAAMNKEEKKRKEKKEKEKKEKKQKKKGLV